jgi:hypothetical protein
MKKHLPWIFALPLFCMPINTVYAVNETTAEPARVTLGVKKSHKHGSKHHSKKQQNLHEKCLGNWSRAYNPIYYVKSIGADGETVITTDETVWQISHSSAKIARNWPENAIVTITPCKNWFAKYDYYLTNNTTNECVNAKLSQGPFLQYAIFITQLNHYNNSVTLSNGMCFHVTSGRNFATWKVGQAVLLGVNNSWFGAANMIININENNFAPAERQF